MKTTFISILLTGLVTMLPFPAVAGSQLEELQPMSLSELEQRLDYIDLHLKEVASFSMRSGTGATGYRSEFHKDTFNKEWVQIDFEKEHTLDDVVLIPAIRRDTQTGFQADAFPRQFRLIAGTNHNPEGTVVAEYTSKPAILPRIAPFVIPCKGITASWIRIEANQLSLRAFDERYLLQFSEIMAFCGQDNVALHQTVSSRSNSREGVAWDERFLVDGFVPYLMDAAEGEKSVAFVRRIIEESLPVLNIDLGGNLPLSRLQLHAVETSDFVPQLLGSDFGIPRRMRLEGATKPDFSDGQLLIDLHLENVYSMSPIMTWAFPETVCRYVRLSIISKAADPADHSPRIGFAEIELFSKGRNVALGRPVTITDSLPVTNWTQPLRPLSLLTDGRNIYGNILPLRDWMKQLALRHELETERPLLVEELNHRYAKQKALLRRMIQLTMLLVLGIFLVILFDRYIRMRQALRIRERIAADLHDELGADLHTIGLYSDMALDSLDSRDELEEALKRIIEFTERSGTAARHCVNILEAKGICENLVEDIRRASRRMLADLHHEIHIEGEEFLLRLDARKRIDFFLFHKECLTNILRHSEATSVSIRITSNNRATRLEVSDNGKGFTNTSKDGVPPSLKRRARLMRARIKVEPTQTGGTRIRLKFKNRKLGFLR